MDQAYGIFLYVVSLLTMGGIYAILALGLNIQFGFTGLFNAGIAGFFAVALSRSPFPYCRSGFESCWPGP